MWLGGFSGEGYDRAGYRAWLRTQKRPMASFLAIHATGAPYALASIGGKGRIKALEHYYRVEKGWKGGPHGFAMADGKLYPGTPISMMTVHSPGWNNIACAYECEGDYRAGRRSWLTDEGQIAWGVMAWAAAEWLEWMGLGPDDKHIRFHREDALTTHKECPGAMEKAWFIGKVREAMNPILAPAPKDPPAVMPISTVKPKPKVYQPGTFRYSEDWLVPMMKRIEGLRLKAYIDKPGFAIGYGHNSTSGIPPIPYDGMVLANEAEADKILRADLDDKLRYVNAWVKVPLEQGMIDALCMHIFQQGPTQFKRRVLTAINNRMHWTAAKIIEKMPHEKPGVEARRRMESARYRGEFPKSWK